MEQIVKKAILPVAGMGTRFLPLSKALPKEMWPVVDKPAVQFIVEEAKNSGIENIVFVNNKKKKIIVDYFKNYPGSMKKLLKSRKKQQALDALQELERLAKNLSFSSVLQDKPLGDGHAILQAAPKIGKEPAAVLFGDDIVESRVPCLKQLMDIFKTCQRPVIALHKIPKALLPSYGVVGVEKIASRVYKIKEIVEKPEPGGEPSDLAIVGKYILTPDVFEFLKKAKVDKGGEIILAKVLAQMLQQGKSVYGYEFEGKWLECGNKLAWLKTDLYLTLRDERFKDDLVNFARENKLF